MTVPQGVAAESNAAFIVADEESALIMAPCSDGGWMMTLEFYNKPAGCNAIRLWQEQGILEEDDVTRLSAIIACLHLAATGDSMDYCMGELSARMYQHGGQDYASFSAYVHAKMAHQNESVEEAQILGWWTMAQTTGDKQLLVLRDPDTALQLTERIIQAPRGPAVLHCETSVLIFVPYSMEDGGMTFTLSEEFASQERALHIVSALVSVTAITADDAEGLMRTIRTLPLGGQLPQNRMTILTMQVMQALNCELDTLLNNSIPDDASPEVVASLTEELTALWEEALTTDWCVVIPSEDTEAIPAVDTNDPLAMMALWGGGSAVNE